MKIAFEITAQEDDVYRITLSSGDDAFFASSDIGVELGESLEIIEIDLERISGTHPTSLYTLSRISDEIGKYFLQNKKAVLYYYCDDLADVPKSDRKQEMWPQEYRSQLFSLMFQKFLIKHDILDMIDITVVLEQDTRPIYMHLIARKEHAAFVDAVKEYILTNYGK